MTKASITRMGILEKAFRLIYVKGYQATSIDDIIATTQLTKGAFYYHFKTKEEMGLAMIRELMAPTMNTTFAGFLKNEPNPSKGIYKLMKTLLLDSPDLLVAYGCPAGNLSQEMAPLNSEFSSSLLDLVNTWEDALKDCIRAGKKTNHIRKDVSEKQVAQMVMSGYWGIRNIGKLHNNTDCYKTYLKELKIYLKGLN